MLLHKTRSTFVLDAQRHHCWAPPRWSCCHKSLLFMGRLLVMQCITGYDIPGQSSQADSVLKWTLQVMAIFA